jgi:hypothetical protein
VGAKQGVALLAKPLAALGRIRAWLPHTSVQARNRPSVVEQSFFIGHWTPSPAEMFHQSVFLGTPTKDVINIHLNRSSPLIADRYSLGLRHSGDLIVLFASLDRVAGGDGRSPISIWSRKGPPQYAKV